MIFKDQPAKDEVRTQPASETLQRELAEVLRQLQEHRQDRQVAIACRLIKRCQQALEWGGCRAQSCGLLLVAIDNLHPVKFAQPRQELHQITSQLSSGAHNAQSASQVHAA